MQNFDHSVDASEKEFMCASCSSSGQTFVVGSFNRLRIFNWTPRREAWEESDPKELQNLYTITSVSWKKDGSKLVLVTQVLMFMFSIAVIISGNYIGVPVWFSRAL